MNRLNRLSAILIQLQSKKIVKAQEIADRFNISLRTVYRDINSLEEGGIPIIGEAGVGYSIMDGYRLPPVMFTKEEATAFLMAEKILDKYTDTYNANMFKSALYKIKAVLRTDEKDFITAIDNNILVLNNTHRQDSTNGATSLQKILTAVNEKKVLSISYTSIYANETTQRYIEPVGIFLQNTNWYLIAWCRLRNDYRNFKVDRIKQQQLTDESFEAKHLPLALFLAQTSKEQKLHTVVIRIKKEVAKYIVTEKYYNGFVSEQIDDAHIEMTFLTASLQGIARWFMMFGDQATILQPEALKEQVKIVLSAISKQLK
jgi:predicted DNA-binding transcriptional regulator YafY